MHANPQTLVGKRVPVLDKGEILCTGILGDDHTIVESARVSFLGESKGDDKDKKLFKYLLYHRHTSPFEMVEFAFRVKAPIFVFRQWMRHRVAEYNEWSARYSEMREEFYIPAHWRVQDKRNKQASHVGELNHAELSAQLEAQCNAAYQLYEQMLSQGVARELARMILPVNTYSVMMMKMNAHALMHFIELRAAPDAQYEIREYARLLYEEFFKPALPWTAEFFDLANEKRLEIAELLQKM
jgi:thymidylate synthase (FAD)